ncbi:MAG: 3'-5' exoribonuclease YhaM family protein [Vicinamibacterales bacterium]
MAPLPRIKDLAVDQAGHGYFLCSRKDVRTTKSGTPFMLFSLHDATGEIAGKLFDDVARYRDQFEAGEFVRVEGHTEVYNGRLELVAHRIRRVNAGPDGDEGFRESDCIPSSPRRDDDMWAELTGRVGEMAHAGLRALVTRLVADNEAQLRRWPAAMNVHHAYRGGLLEHLLQVARVCRALGEIYDADQDLLLAGAILHDIGKLRELDYDLTTSYTREGCLVGHIAIGLTMVREASQGLASLSSDCREELEHLIASHHGSREFGSPVEPASIEAFILAMADDLDAKLFQVRKHIADDEGAGAFTAYHSRLKRVFLKPPGAAP